MVQSNRDIFGSLTNFMICSYFNAAFIVFESSVNTFSGEVMNVEIFGLKFFEKIR